MPISSRRDDFFKRGLHRIIARNIRNGSDVIARARDLVEQWDKSTPEPKPVYINAWKEILSRQNEEIARIITRPSVDMDQWRCSSPLRGSGLTFEERKRLATICRKLSIQ